MPGFLLGVPRLALGVPRLVLGVPRRPLGAPGFLLGVPGFLLGMKGLVHGVGGCSRGVAGLVLGVASALLVLPDFLSDFLRSMPRLDAAITWRRMGACGKRPGGQRAHCVLLGELLVLLRTGVRATVHVVCLVGLIHVCLRRSPPRRELRPLGARA